MCVRSVEEAKAQAQAVADELDAARVALVSGCADVCGWAVGVGHKSKAGSASIELWKSAPGQSGHEGFPEMGVRDVYRNSLTALQLGAQPALLPIHALPRGAGV